jgi:hypothetical protein
MRAVLRGEIDADVPCDGCIGCCSSGYPIPLRPGDRVALDGVPAAHLALPAGGRLARMMPREDGTCPMLCGRLCTIYTDRPRTCRDYDCRIYAAAGLMPDGERPVIQQRVGEWSFVFEDDTARAQAVAVRRAAHFIRSHAELFPAEMRAFSATAAAVLAVKCFALFMDAAEPEPRQRAQQVINVAREFDGLK